MKKYLILLAIASFSLSFVSCEKDTIEETVAAITPASMSATVNDTVFTTITRVTVFSSTANAFLITGTSLDGKVLSVTIRASEVGTYTTSIELEDPSSKVGAAWRAHSENFVSNSGTVELTKVDKTKKKISGTFTFTMINPTSGLTEVFSITEGKFDQLSYTEGTIPGL